MLYGSQPGVPMSYSNFSGVCRSQTASAPSCIGWKGRCQMAVCLNLCKFNLLQEMATQYKYLKALTEKSELRKAFSVLEHTVLNMFSPCVWRSQPILWAHFPEWPSLSSTAVFTAKCTNMQANHNSIKFIFSHGSFCETREVAESEQ